MTKICVICETQFTPSKRTESYAVCCSGKCNLKKWRKEHPEHNNKIKNDWRRKNGILQKGSKEHRYNAAIKNRKDWAKTKRNISLKTVEGWHSKVEWQELKEKFNYTCVCCGKKEPDIKLSRDHIIPLSKNGSNDISNIQPLCKSCNSKKYNKTTNFICQL